MPLLAQIKALSRSFVNFFALVVGVSAGVAQLADLGQGPGRIILTGVGLLCLFFLVVRWWYLYYDAQIDELRERCVALEDELQKADDLVATQQAQLLTLQVGHQRYLDAIEGVVDQEGPHFRERLEMTVTVGTDDDTDTVIERHHTVPGSRVPQRSFRPVLPTGATGILGLEELGLRAEVLSGSGHITPLPLVKNGHLRIWLVFDPGLTAPAEWEVTYQPKGLWRPLRQRGADSLVWTDRLPVGNGDTSVLTELVVRFVFPPSRQRPSVTERRGYGEILVPTRIEGSDSWLVEFRDRQPAGRRYEWDLAQPVRVPSTVNGTPPGPN